MSGGKDTHKGDKSMSNDIGYHEMFDLFDEMNEQALNMGDGKRWRELRESLISLFGEPGTLTTISGPGGLPPVFSVGEGVVLVGGQGFNLRVGRDKSRFERLMHECAE
jgi:hypothetical protein